MIFTQPTSSWIACQVSGLRARELALYLVLWVGCHLSVGTEDESSFVFLSRAYRSFRCNHIMSCTSRAFWAMNRKIYFLFVKCVTLWDCHGEREVTDLSPCVQTAFMYNQQTKYLLSVISVDHSIYGGSQERRLRFPRLYVAPHERGRGCGPCQAGPAVVFIAVTFSSPRSVKLHPSRWSLISCEWPLGPSSCH